MPATLPVVPPVVIHCSVAFVTGDPPKANAAVGPPAPAKPRLAIVMLAGALLHTPLLYSSVKARAGPPPKANADV